MGKHKLSSDVFGVIISTIAFIICVGGVIKYWETDHTKIYFVLGIIGAGIEGIESCVHIYHRRRNKSISDDAGDDQY